MNTKTILIIGVGAFLGFSLLRGMNARNSELSKYKRPSQIGVL